MKNDSPLFPLDHLGDSLYDINGDGALSGFETMMRDCDILDEMDENSEEDPSPNDFQRGPGTSDENETEDGDVCNGDDDAFEDDEEDEELNALLASFSKSLNKRKDTVEKLRLKLDLIADKLNDLAWDLEREAEDLEYDSICRSDMESFADTLNEALDPLNEAIRTLDDLNYMYF